MDIADATADAIHARRLRTVGLLATGYTMEQDFYTGRLRDAHGLNVRVPDADDRRIVHDVIYRELCLGVISETSRDRYRRVIAQLAEQGAKGIVLGCTEIDLLISADDSPMPLFDSTGLHTRKAVDLALT